MNAATEFDLGPLTWVKGEIDLALERAEEAFGQYLAEADVTKLKFCRTHVHQVHGALSIVGLDGITQAQAQAVFALEVALRQQANALYADAAGHVIAGLDTAQHQLSGLLDTVRQRIAHHDSVSHWISLATSLLNLGRAVLARSPERILATLDTVRERLREVAGD